MLLALGVVAALCHVRAGGAGQVVDAAMVDGAALLSAMIWGLRASGGWQEERGVNLLDSGAPFYDVYECADGRFVAVGALEEKFRAALCRVLGMPESEAAQLADRSRWVEAKERLAAAFRRRTRDEWVERAAAEHGDACLVPVLSAREAVEHPHNVARGVFSVSGGVVQPSPAPRFSETPAVIASPPCSPGERGRAALIDWGVRGPLVDSLVAAGVVAVA